jgi:plastocyanin
LTRHTLTISVFAVLAVLFALPGCGGNDNKSTTAATSTTTPTNTTTTGEGSNSHGTKNFAGKTSGEVELDDFYFQPTTLTGKPGQTLTLELKNDGKTEHNFTLSDQNIDQDLQPDANTTVKVKFPSSGKVSFFCKYHKSQGMTGSLAIVSSSGSSDDNSGSSSGGSGSGGSSSDDSTTTDSSGGGGSY